MRRTAAASCLLLAVFWLALPALAADDEGDAGDDDGAAAGEAEEAPEPEAAQEEAPAGPASYTRDGWYVAVSGVAAYENFRGSNLGTSNAMGVSGRLGYRFLEYWGLEFEYERLLEFRMRSNPTIKFEPNIFTANGRGYVPFWKLGSWAERLHPYFLLGMGLHQVNINDRGTPYGKFGAGEKGAFTGRFGGGSDLYLTDQLVLFTEGSYVLPASHDNKEMQYTAFHFGVQWRFRPVEE